MLAVQKAGCASAMCSNMAAAHLCRLRPPAHNVLSVNLIRIHWPCFAWAGARLAGAADLCAISA